MSLELPVRNDIRSYSFSIALDGEVFILQFDFNYRLQEWVLDIFDADANLLIAGLPIQTNVDLFSRYPVSGLPKGAMMAIDETGQERNPNEDNFGNEIKLVYLELADLVD